MLAKQPPDVRLPWLSMEWSLVIQNNCGTKVSSRHKKSKPKGSTCFWQDLIPSGFISYNVNGEKLPIWTDKLFVEWYPGLTTPRLPQMFCIFPSGRSTLTVHLSPNHNIPTKLFQRPLKCLQWVFFTLKRNCLVGPNESHARAKHWLLQRHE